MTYELFIGDRTFSSWSMRGWLMLEKFNLDFKTTMIGLYSGTMKAEMAKLPLARTVPALRTPEGDVLTDSIAIAEALVERHPDQSLYPSAPSARVFARNFMAEMHSNFGNFRGDCPNNLDNIWIGFQPSDTVLNDVARIEEMFAFSQQFQKDGPWLFGAYSIVDAYFAPYACRLVTYGLPLSDALRTYVDTHLADPAFRRWRAMGQTVIYDPFPYQLDLKRAQWPGDRIAARAVEAGTPENSVCPYSGKDITHLMAIGDRVFGFCNAFCRDKTVADPAAWPAFMALYQQG